MNRIRDIDSLQATVIFEPIDALASEWRGRIVRPQGSIRFYVVRGVRADGQLLTFPAGLRLETVLNPSGFYLSFNRLRQDNGVPYYGGLPAGSYTIQARSTTYQPFTLNAVLIPRHNRAIRFRLLPGVQYPFAEWLTIVRGVLREPNAVEADRQPIPGAVVRADGHPACFTTGDRGEWVLWLDLAKTPEPVTIRATLSDGQVRSSTITLGKGEPVPAVDLL